MEPEKIKAIEERREGFWRSLEALRSIESDQYVDIEDLKNALDFGLPPNLVLLHFVNINFPRHFELCLSYIFEITEYLSFSIIAKIITHMHRQDEFNEFLGICEMRGFDIAKFSSSLMDSLMNGKDKINGLDEDALQRLSLYIANRDNCEIRDGVKIIYSYDYFSDQPPF